MKPAQKTKLKFWQMIKVPSTWYETNAIKWLEHGEKNCWWLLRGNVTNNRFVQKMRKIHQMKLKTRIWVCCRLLISTYKQLIFANACSHWPLISLYTVLHITQTHGKTIIYLLCNCIWMERTPSKVAHILFPSNENEKENGLNMREATFRT